MNSHQIDSRRNVPVPFFIPEVAMQHISVLHLGYYNVAAVLEQVIDLLDAGEAKEARSVLEKSLSELEWEFTGH